MTTIFNDISHPRERSGKFTDRSRPDAVVELGSVPAFSEDALTRARTAGGAARKDIANAQRRVHLAAAREIAELMASGVPDARYLNLKFFGGTQSFWADTVVDDKGEDLGTPWTIFGDNSDTASEISDAVREIPTSYPVRDGDGDPAYDWLEFGNQPGEARINLRKARLIEA